MIRVGLLLAGSLALTSMSALHAAVIKLNDPLAAPQAIIAYTLSPDTNTVAYVMGDNSTHVATLYSVPAQRTSAPVQLNGTVASGAIGPISLNTDLTPKISNDSQRVVYPSDEANEDEIELYSVPIGGGTRTLLTAFLGASEDVTSFAFVPGTNKLVFIAGDSGTGAYDLYSVPVDGSAAATNLTSTTTRRPALGYRFSPDNTKIFFQGIDASSSSILDVFSVPVDGGTLQQLSSLGRAFLIYPLVTNDKLFFLADPVTTQQYNLYAVPANGSSAPVQVNPTLTSISADAALSRHFPEENRVTFRISDFNLSQPESLWLANDDGSGATRMHPDTFDTDSVLAYTKDRTRALIIGRPVGNLFVDAYFINVNGSGSPTIVTTPFSSVSGSVFTGTTKDYFFFQGQVPGVGLEFVRYNPVTDTLVTPLQGKGVAYTSFPSPIFNDDDSAFVFGVSGSGPTALYTYSFATDLTKQITGTFVSGGGLDTSTLRPILFACNGTAVIYPAEQDIDLVTELYVNTDPIVLPASANRAWSRYE